MRRLFGGFAAVVALAAPAFAALQPGVQAPDFTAQAYLAGEPFTFRLAKALKKGPVVVYFFPAAHTEGCNLEAHLFSEAADKFKAQKVTLIGVTSGNIAELADFSKETEHCGGKFPVAADPDTKIATSYDNSHPLKPEFAKPGLPNMISGRTSFLISPDGKILSSYRDKDPKDHVNQMLAAIQAYRVKK